jgi:glycosyltransferase involved in cell wall biosynthesis
MSFACSVSICTHNPRPEYLSRTLEALQEQTLERAGWELLLVDNSSAKPLADTWDLRWHPHGRHLREEQLGLTPARLCAIRDARSDLLIFVDDDNLLFPDYLSGAVEIAARWPMLGVWGGQTIGEFASPPPDWLYPYQSMIAVYTFDQDRWSNQMDDQCLPCGAGMCVRRSVAQHYLETLLHDSIRSQLDRLGDLLVSGGDTDIAMLACELGFGTGRFQRLRLKHLIPEQRFSEDYLVRLSEGMNYSHVLLQAIHGLQTVHSSARRRTLNFTRALFANRRERRLRLAALSGQRKAEKFIRENPELARRT